MCIRMDYESAKIWFIIGLILGTIGALLKLSLLNLIGAVLVLLFVYNFSEEFKDNAPFIVAILGIFFAALIFTFLIYHACSDYDAAVAAIPVYASLMIAVSDLYLVSIANILKQHKQDHQRLLILVGYALDVVAPLLLYVNILLEYIVGIVALFFVGKGIYTSNPPKSVFS